MKSYSDNRHSDVIEQHSPIKGMPNITLMKECVRCHQKYAFTIPVADYRRWVFDRVPIRKAMPYFRTEQLEMFTSQICPTCYKLFFRRKL
jgi:hypothetical protein